MVWTSRRNLEALRLTSGTGMTEWQSARMVPNENAVVTALQVGWVTFMINNYKEAKRVAGESTQGRNEGRRMGCALYSTWRCPRRVCSCV